MQLKDICSFLDSAIPLSFQESYDNSGLQVGEPEKEISSAIISLDITEEVIEEAVRKGTGLIISHHPVIFTGLKKITGRSSSERIIAGALKNGIALYSAHTNLDVTGNGVSRKMAEKLNLHDTGVLVPLKHRLMKLVTFIPEGYLENVRQAVFSAGAGLTGNYDQCSFSSSGTGTFRGNEESNPFTGKKGELHFEKEFRFETIFPSHLREEVIRALIVTHPYEEVAYDIFQLENDFTGAGMGCTGVLPEEMSTDDFLQLVSSVFLCRGMRYSLSGRGKIRRVAVCGGSGAGLINDAINSGSDAYVTADIKYHSFFEAKGRILLIDAGHFETEKFSAAILYDLIIKKFPTFALRFSETNTNPINYY